MSFPIARRTLATLAATGLLYLVMMGSTFSSLGVVLPHMIASLHLSWSEAGAGFTLLATAAGLSSMLPALVIRRRSARTSLGLGVLTLMLAYAAMALARGAWAYDLGAALLGVGFGLIGSVPALHILGGLEQRRRSLVFGAYLAFGGLGGALWPTVFEAAVATLGDWRLYWWFMVALMGAAGAICLPLVTERRIGQASSDHGTAEEGWSFAEALRTPQFYLIGGAIAATYLVASTVNAFTFSHLKAVGVEISVAVATFSIQSFCHAAFPLLMGGVAGRVGVKALLVFGLAVQAVGMTALAVGSSLPVLMVFAIGVGGGYGTIFLATTLALQDYFGRRNYAQIFGGNQLFTTISVVGPALAGWAADLTGRFDISFEACAALLALMALATATLRPPERRPALVPAAAE